MMYKLTTLLLAVAAFTAFDTARASVIFSDNFDSYNQNPLAGQGGWNEISSGSVAYPVNVVADPTNSSNQVAALGGSSTSPTYSGEDLYNALSAAVTYTTGESLELDFKLNVSVAQASGGDYFIAFGSVNTASITSYYGRVFAVSDGASGFYLGLSATTSTGTYGTTSLALGTTYDISYVWNLAGGTGKDTFSLYVDGALYETYTWAGTGTTPAQLATMILRQGGSTSAPVLTLDDISAQLLVPEPSTPFLLLGATLAGALWRRPGRAGTAASQSLHG